MAGVQSPGHPLHRLCGYSDAIGASDRKDFPIIRRGLSENGVGWSHHRWEWPDCPWLWCMRPFNNPAAERGWKRDNDTKQIIDTK